MKPEYLIPLAVGGAILWFVMQDQTGRERQEAIDRIVQERFQPPTLTLGDEWMTTYFGRTMTTSSATGDWRLIDPDTGEVNLSPPTLTL